MTSRSGPANEYEDDVTVTSPSKELKFGIDRILDKNSDEKNASATIGKIIIMLCNLCPCIQLILCVCASLSVGLSVCDRLQKTNNGLAKTFQFIYNVVQLLADFDTKL